MVLGFACMPQAVMAQTSALNTSAAASEERVKAAFLYKFVSYVEWPPSALPKGDSPYVIAVIGAEDVAAELNALVAGRTINNRTVTVKKLHASSSLDGIHVLFIGASERNKQAQLIKQLQSQPVLLVTETDGALAQGSMINFRLAEERVRFEVSLGPVEKAGLKLNSRLLSVALSVIKGTPQ